MPIRPIDGLVVVQYQLLTCYLYIHNPKIREDLIAFKRWARTFGGVIIKLLIIGIGLMLAYRMLSPRKSIDTPSGRNQEDEGYTDYEIIEDDDT